MVKMEREILAHVEQVNLGGYDDPMLVEGSTRIETEGRYPQLNSAQRETFDQIFLSREKIVGLGWSCRGRQDDYPCRDPRRC